MPDQMSIAEVVQRCEQYWSATHVPRRAAKEMRAELASHLEEAIGAGKSPETVVGTDLNQFAEEWAQAYRRPMVVDKSRFRQERIPRNTQMMWSVIAIAALSVLILIFTPKENDVENEVLQWAFLVGALLLFVGEILTAGFFLLPFAIGAAIAAVMAFVGVPPAITLIAFLVISGVALVGLQRWTDTDDDQPAVGSNRYADKTGIVSVTISRAEGTGRVRVDTEDWMASTDLPDTIHEGTEVNILEVRGTRLIVSPVE